MPQILSRNSMQRRVSYSSSSSLQSSSSRSPSSLSLLSLFKGFETMQSTNSSSRRATKVSPYSSRREYATSSLKSNSSSIGPQRIPTCPGSLHNYSGDDTSFANPQQVTTASRSDENIPFHSSRSGPLNSTITVSKESMAIYNTIKSLSRQSFPSQGSKGFKRQIFENSSFNGNHSEIASSIVHQQRVNRNADCGSFLVPARHSHDDDGWGHYIDVANADDELEQRIKHYSRYRRKKVI